jgi:hypothetical protein
MSNRRHLDWDDFETISSNRFQMLPSMSEKVELPRYTPDKGPIKRWDQVPQKSWREGVCRGET